jgi:hypothetical protein
LPSVAKALLLETRFLLLEARPLLLESGCFPTPQIRQEL